MGSTNQFDPGERVVYKTVADTPRRQPSDEADIAVATSPIATVGDVHLSMDLFRPEEREPSDSKPAIIFFHGGAWNGGAPSQFHPHCHYLASRGMLAVSAEYRLKDTHGTTPYECVTDGKSAIRWVRENAATLGVDPGRIAAGGGSAGGHVAVAAATLLAFEPDGEDLSISCRPDALVLFNPVIDNGPGGAGHDRVKDRWRNFSPMHNIATGVPPAIVFLGTEDSFIPVSTAEEFKRRMSAVGARCDLWTYDGQPHGFFNYRDGSNPYYYATVLAADRFLAALGYLEGAPTVQREAVEATRP